MHFKPNDQQEKERWIGAGNLPRDFFGREAIPDSLAFDLNLSFIRNLDQFIKLIFFSYFLFTKEIARRESMMIEFAVIWAHGIHRKSANRFAVSISCFLALVDTLNMTIQTAVSCASAEKSSKQQRHVSQISFKTQVQETPKIWDISFYVWRVAVKYCRFF